MVLNSWHTPTARGAESRFNHFCCKNPTVLYYVHRWCLKSFAASALHVKCQAGSIAFPAQVTVGKLHFSLLEPCRFPSIPIFTFHLKQLSNKKSIYYSRPHLAGMKAEVQMRMDYAPWG